MVGRRERPYRFLHSREFAFLIGLYCFGIAGTVFAGSNGLSWLNSPTYRAEDIGTVHLVYAAYGQPEERERRRPDLSDGGYEDETVWPAEEGDGDGGKNVSSQGIKTGRKRDGQTPKPEQSRRGAGTTPEPSAAVSTLRPGRKRYEEDVVVVVDPPKGFEERAANLGFHVIQEKRLESLSLTMNRLTIPRGMKPPDAVHVLEQEFPGLLTDVNTVSNASHGPVMAWSYVRSAVGWPQSGPGCGRGVKLGMIDGAIDLEHPAIKGQKVTYKSFHNPARKPGSVDHGTAIGAMLVGKPSEEGFGGILPAAQLFAANIFEVNDAGKSVANATGLLNALDWLASIRPHAINLSLSGVDNRILRLAFAMARKEGLIMVAAAGNWGIERPAYPAAYQDVLAVTAVTEDLRIYKHANRGRYIDFAAPGVGIWTAVPGGGRYQTGTSFATTYIAALSGLAVANGVKPNPNTLRAAFKKYSVDLGAPGRDKTYGWGYVHMTQKCGS